MHRFRSWTLDPPEWRTQRNRLLSAEGGDGSTLNIDFTNGTLDPKLSHSRGSNATFINSSGYVEWAAANMYTNSAWNDATATPSGWTAFGLSATATVAIAADPEARTIAVTTGAGNQPFLYVTPTVSQGVVYTASVEIVSVTHGSGGAPEEVQYNQVLAAPFASTFTYYMNGSNVAASAKVTQTGVLTCVYVAGASSQIRIGFASAPRNNCSVTVKAPQHQPGDVRTRTSFFRRTAADGAYYAPRFDYNPTTLESNGLLIEGNVTNLTALSESFAPSGGSNNWNTPGLFNGVVSSTNQVNPAGITSSIRLLENNVNEAHGVFTSISLTSGSQYTFSVFVRGDGTRTLAGIRITLGGAATDYSVIFDLVDGTTGTAYTAGSPGTVITRAVQHINGWWRLSVTINAPSASTLFYIYNATTKNATAGLQAFQGSNGSNGIYIWGAQVESGNGASSYVPTGVNTVSKTHDSVTFTDRNWFSSWTSTWFADYKIFNCTALPTLFYARSSQDGFNNYLNIVINSNHSLTNTLSRSNSNAVQQWSTSNPVLSITEEFNKCAWVIDDTAKIANAGIVDFTSTSGRALPLGSGLSAFELGLNTVAGTSCSMWLKSLKYYPKALSNQELIDLTKPTIPSSSLDLDFTSGTLSSLLTFTRGSNATFITSTGLVQYAQSNEFRNTTWITSTTPTGWNVGFGTGTTTWNNNGTVTMDTGSTGTRPMVNSSSISVVLGMPYTFGYRVVSVSGSPTIANVIHSTVAGETFAINGINVAPTTVVQNGDIVSCTFTPTATATVPPRMGPGVQGNMSNTAMTITEPQMNQGLTLQKYLPNTSTSAANYNTPRFTYDQTTLAPQGLLLEGNATNICTYSADMTQSGGGHWSVRTGLLTTGWTGFTAPDGTASAVKIIPDTTSSRHTLESSSTTITSGLVYTASAFVKADGYSVVSLIVAGGQTRRNFTLSGNGTVESQFGLSNTATITPIGSSGWYRVTMTWTANITGNAGFWIGVPQNAATDVVTAWSGNGTSGVQAWGAQLELGHGASSFIYTGASSAQRIQEQLYTTTGVSAWAGADSPNRSIFTDLTVLTNDPAHFPQIVWIGNTSLNYRDDVFYYNQSGAVQLYISGTYGGAPLDWSRTIGNTFVVPPQARKKLAIGLRPGTMVSTIDGATGPTNAGSPSSLVLNALYLGPASQNSTRKGSIILRSFKYWISRLNYSQLRFITG